MGYCWVLFESVFNTFVEALLDTILADLGAKRVPKLSHVGSMFRALFEDGRFIDFGRPSNENQWFLALDGVQHGIILGCIFEGVS